MYRLQSMPKAYMVWWHDLVKHWAKTILQRSVNCHCKQGRLKKNLVSNILEWTGPNLYSTSSVSKTGKTEEWSSSHQRHTIITADIIRCDDAVTDPEGPQGPWPPSPNFAPFAYENMYQTRPLARLAPDIGPWTKHFAPWPPHLNPGSAPKPIWSFLIYHFYPYSHSNMSYYAIYPFM